MAHNKLLDILVVDDEIDIRRLVSDILHDAGYNARIAANSTDAINEINKKVPNAIVLDIWLQNSELDGLGILEIIKKRYPLLPVIIISGHGTIQTAVTAIKMGAYDYIEKPFTHDKLMIVLKRACESAKLKKENIDLKMKVIDKTELVGTSHSLTKLKHEIDKVAQSAIRVMISGCIGSGKELAARLIHKKSKYANGPFIMFSPIGLSIDKINQELFGELRSDEDIKNNIKRISVLEASNKGTMYIDEICDMPLECQSKLLKILQDQQMVKPNGTVIKVDVRIISSSARNLDEEIQNGKLRQDLYYRLNVASIKIPSLEDRKEDIPLLVQHFVHQLVKFSGMKHRDFSEEAIAALQAYNWPGNIRQLRNVVEWALIMNPNVDNSPVRADMLPQEVVNNTVSINNPNAANNLDVMALPLREARELFEKQYLAAQMSRFNNNISKTSAFVGMERSALHRKLKLLNIHSSAKIKDLEHFEDELLDAIHPEIAQ